MSKAPFPFVPTADLLDDIEPVIARRRVFRRWCWKQRHGPGARMPSTLQFRISHGLQADCYVSEEALREAELELDTKLAFFAAFPKSDLQPAA